MVFCFGGGLVFIGCPVCGVAAGLSRALRSSPPAGLFRCGGGSFDAAYKYVLNNTGLDSDLDYPYQGMNLACWEAAAARKVATISKVSEAKE